MLRLNLVVYVARPVEFVCCDHLDVPKSPICEEQTEKSHCAYVSVLPGIIQECSQQTRCMSSDAYSVRSVRDGSLYRAYRRYQVWVQYATGNGTEETSNGEPNAPKVAVEAFP